MNNWRILGLVLAAAFAAWLGLRGCTPEETPQPAAPPVRDQFHASRSLRVTVDRAAPAEGTDQAADADTSWLERELRYLLIRGQMRVAAIEPGARPAFTLHLTLPRPPQTAATVKLIAPDNVVDRERTIEVGDNSLATIQSLATMLPEFLGATRTGADWVQLIGTTDLAAYETFLRSANELFGPHGRGFTQPPAADSSDTLNRLETLTRRHPKFARAWALRSVAYLGLGGEDEASLTKLAESAAERGLALDPALPDAQSAQGLVRLRRGEWVAALEYFNAAIAVDANASAALEGLACLLIDVGHARAALPIAERAALLQPASIGANECLVYARLATGDANAAGESQGEPIAIAQVKALEAILEGQVDSAQKTLRGATNTKNAAAWIDPLLRAASNKQRTSEALQAITRAASDGLIDPSTELVCGAALRQSDFVFNRMLRLHKQQEAVPLRIFWLPKTAFLRQHARFEDIVGAEGLLPFWQENGQADICAAEPKVYGCGAKKRS